MAAAAPRRNELDSDRLIELFSERGSERGDDVKISNGTDAVFRVYGIGDVLAALGDPQNRPFALGLCDMVHENLQRYNVGKEQRVRFDLSIIDKIKKVIRGTDDALLDARIGQLFTGEDRDVIEHLNESEGGTRRFSQLSPETIRFLFLSNHDLIRRGRWWRVKPIQTYKCSRGPGDSLRERVEADDPPERVASGSLDGAVQSSASGEGLDGESPSPHGAEARVAADSSAVSVQSSPARSRAASGEGLDGAVHSGSLLADGAAAARVAADSSAVSVQSSPARSRAASGEGLDGAVHSGSLLADGAAAARVAADSSAVSVQSSPARSRAASGEGLDGAVHSGSLLAEGAAAEKAAAADDSPARVASIEDLDGAVHSGSLLADGAAAEKAAERSLVLVKEKVNDDLSLTSSFKRNMMLFFLMALMGLGVIISNLLVPGLVSHQAFLSFWNDANASFFGVIVFLAMILITSGIWFWQLKGVRESEESDGVQQIHVESDQPHTLIMLGIAFIAGGVSSICIDFQVDLFSSIGVGALVGLACLTILFSYTRYNAFVSKINRTGYLSAHSDGFDKPLTDCHQPSSSVDASDRSSPTPTA